MRCTGGGKIAPLGKHNPKSGDWSTVEVIETTLSNRNDD